MGRSEWSSSSRTGIADVVAERVAAEVDLESASIETRDFIVSVTHFSQAMYLALLTSYVESVIW